jgi:hypothetical protein
MSKFGSIDKVLLTDTRDATAQRLVRKPVLTVNKIYQNVF